MPVLLEDLVLETSASLRRAADRLDEEAKNLDDQHRADAGLDELKRKTVESARQATRYALSRLPQTEAVWESAIVALREKIGSDDAKRLLRSLGSVFEAGQRLFKAPRELWALANSLGASVEGMAEIDQARQRFEDLAREIRLALEHREWGWQATDADRLAQGLQLAREGKTIKADAARSRFRRN